MNAALHDLLQSLNANLPAAVRKCGVLFDRALVLRLATAAGTRYLYLAPDCMSRAVAYGPVSPHADYPHASWLGAHLTPLETAQLLRAEALPSENVLLLVFSTPSHLWLHFFGQSGNAVLTSPDQTILAAWHLHTHHPPGAPYHRTSPAAPRELISVMEPAALVAHLTNLACEDLRRTVARHLRSQRARLLHRLAKIDADAARAARAAEFRHHAVLLRAYYHLIKPHRDSVQVPDPEHPDTTITIPLDPRKSPQENLRWYFHQAEKWQRAPAAIARRRQETVEALAALDRQIGTLPSLQDLAALRAMLPPPPPTKQRPKTDRGLARFRRFRSSDGFLIIAGRSARDNDELTCRVAHGHDLWLHTRNRPGAHVIIRARRNQPVPIRTLREAALVCAHLSKVPDGEVEEILYTQRKHVAKPKGAQPGMVLVAGGKTITVRERATAMEEWLRTHQWDAPDPQVEPESPSSA
ncbi:MAG: NFACT RNA binding domain-containing protein [bacterium]|nr:NFACT RNA binding domain-containing protein [bacterium]